jgi:hypothetical protein
MSEEPNQADLRLARQAAIREQIDRLTTELRELIHQESEFDAQQLVGRCFKHHKTQQLFPPAAWWIYARVIEVRDALPCAFTFEERPEGHFELEASLRGYNWANGEWREIPLEEFRAAWSRFIAHLASVAFTAATGLTPWGRS